MSIAILCQGLSKSFGAVRAVHGVELEVRQGEFLALLGPSGCGKTTLLRLIAGFEAPDEGAIDINRRRVAGPGVFVPPEQRRVGMVFQDFALFPHMTVAQNVAYGLRRSPDRRRRLAWALELVGLGGLERRMVHELSGGQQQRVALARALAPNPEVILLDEPFSNLDASRRVLLREEVRQILKAAGATTLFVTHDQEEALSLADRVAVMWEGTVLQVDPPESLYVAPASPAVASFVGDANILPGVARGTFVDSPLGPLALHRQARGEVRIVLRPESLRLKPASGGSGTVVRRDFYGHDQVVTVQLPADVLVRVRLLQGDGVQVGDRVALRVEGPVVVLPGGAARNGSEPGLGGR